MKKSLALLTAAVLLLTAFSGCGKKRAAEEQTTLSAENAATQSTATPYFLLSDLPRLGEHSSGTVCARFYEEYTTELKASDDYGNLLIYIGDCREYYAVDRQLAEQVTASRYGVMTVGGKIVTDAVYNAAYTVSDDANVFLVLEKYSGYKKATDTYSTHTTVAPLDGEWVLNFDGNSTLLTPGDGRLVIENNSAQTISVYDYRGQLLYTLNGREASGFVDGAMSYYSTAGAEVSVPQDEQTLPDWDWDFDEPTVEYPTAAAPTTTAPPAATAAPEKSTTAPATTQPQTAAPSVTTTVAGETTTTRVYRTTTLPPTTASPTVSPTVRAASVKGKTSLVAEPVAVAANSISVKGYTLINADGAQLTVGLKSIGQIENGVAFAQATTGYGIVRTTGVWLVEPKYETARAYSGTFFAFGSGGKITIADLSMKTVATLSTAAFSARSYFCAGSTLVYSVFNSSGNYEYYNGSTNKKIVCADNQLPATKLLDGTDTFFALDGSSVAYLFDVEGKTVSTVQNAVSLEFCEDGYYGVKCRGENGESTLNIFTLRTGKPVLSVTIPSGDDYASCITTGEDSSLLIIYHGKISQTRGLYDVYSAKSGKYLYQNCLDVVSQTVSNRSYFSFAYANYCAVCSEQLKLLLKIPNQYTD